jgi:hypothetical protein
LKNEDFASRKKLKEMLGMCHETIDKAIFLDKIFLPFTGNSKISIRRT